MSSSPHEPDAPVVAASPAPAAPPTPPPSSTPWRMPRPSRWAIAVGAILAIVAILLILLAWRLPPFDTAVRRTEDAYVRGYTTVIAPQVEGYVWRVHVQDFQRVRAGELLVEIDPRPFDQRVEQARAVLAARLADLANNEQTLQQAVADEQVQSAAILSSEASRVKAALDVRRSNDLVRDGSLARRENDADVATLAEAVATERQARATRYRALVGIRSVRVNRQGLAAQVQQARAALHDAELNRSYADIRAPRDGVLSETGVRTGQYASAGTPLMFMVPLERWVIAYYKERQTHGMAPGQAAWFSVDALGGAVIHGHVQRISPATASEFSAIKPENGTGNFTKVPQRIGVQISVDPGQPLGERITPGMSVVAHVQTGG